jgi:hypothetical protein
MTRARDLAKGTFSGDLTVDTNTLVVDSANNRVGVGTASPTETLDVSGNIRALGANSRVLFGPDGFEAGIKYATDASLQIASRTGEPITFTNGHDGTERMKIDSSGRVTMPYQPAFSVYANTNETTSSGASAPFNGIIFDQGSNYSTANRRFVAPVAGIYQFSTYGNANDVSSGSPMWCAFAVNGTYRGAYMYLTVTAGGSPWMLIGGTQTIKLVANDYVEVKAGVSMHWDYGSAVWSNFSGHLVG